MVVDTARSSVGGNFMGTTCGEAWLIMRVGGSVGPEATSSEATAGAVSSCIRIKDSLYSISGVEDMPGCWDIWMRCPEMRERRGRQ